MHNSKVFLCTVLDRIRTFVKIANRENLGGMVNVVQQYFSLLLTENERFILLSSWDAIITSLCKLYIMVAFFNFPVLNLMHTGWASFVDYSCLKNSSFICLFRKHMRNIFIYIFFFNHIQLSSSGYWKSLFLGNVKN